VSIGTLGGLVLAFLRFFRSKTNNPGGATKSSNLALSEQFSKGLREEFVSKDVCVANIKTLETSVNLTKEVLVGKIDGLSQMLVTELRTIKAEVKKS